MGTEALKGDGGVETSAPVDERERLALLWRQMKGRGGQERKEAPLGMALHPSLSLFRSLDARP